MNKLKELYRKYEEVILYLFFGGATTVVNFLVYSLCKWFLYTTPKISQVVAWVVSVLFAYIVNKLFVFKSKSMERKVLLVELLNFFAARGVSGLLELLAVVVFVERLGINDYLIKTLAAIIVVLLNYIFSKLIIFKKEKQ